jgi:hypothetical protein
MVIYGDSFSEEGETGRELREFSRMFNHRWTQMDTDEPIAWIGG